MSPYQGPFSAKLMEPFRQIAGAFPQLFAFIRNERNLVVVTEGASKILNDTSAREDI